MSKIKSENLQIYPTAYRGKVELQNKKIVVYNPAAKLNTEENIIKPYLYLSTYENDATNHLNSGSFVINYDKIKNIIKFILHGYYFEIKNTDQIFTSSTQKYYAHLYLRNKNNLTEPTIQNIDNIEFNPEIICPDTYSINTSSTSEGTTNNVVINVDLLDSEGLDGFIYFDGLTIDNDKTISSLLNHYSLLLLDKGEVPITSILKYKPQDILGGVDGSSDKNLSQYLDTSKLKVGSEGINCLGDVKIGNNGITLHYDNAQLNFDKKCAINNELYANNTTIDGGLSVSYASQFLSSVSIGYEDPPYSNSLEVNGSTLLEGNLVIFDNNRESAFNIDSNTGGIWSKGNLGLGGSGYSNSIFKVDSSTGNTTIKGTTNIGGTLNVGVEGAKFTVNPGNGNTTIKGTLGVTGATNLSSNLNILDTNSNTKFSVTSTNGNTSIAGTLGVTKATTLQNTLDVTSDFKVNTNKFTVTGSNGNTTIAGTLGVTGVTNLSNDLNILDANNNTKFGVVQSNGNTTIKGTLTLSGAATLSNNFTIKNASGVAKFSVTASDGSTTINGTLGVSGNIIGGGTMTATSFYASSDKRLKENIVKYTPENSILDLPIYKYDFIKGPKNQIGCLAQDLKEICPEIVKENLHGYLSINESKLIYLVLDEVKKLKERIEELEKK